MTTFFIIYFLFTVLNNILGTIIGLLIIGLIINGFYNGWIFNFGDGHDVFNRDNDRRLKGEVEERKSKFFSKTIARYKKIGISLAITIFLLVIIPSQKTIIAYYIFNNIDKYNAEKIDSNLKPDNILEIIDNTLNKINNLLKGNKDQNIK